MLKRFARSPFIQSAYKHCGLPLLRAQPLPSTVIGPVKGTHPSLAVWVEQQSTAGNPAHSLRRLGQAETIRNQPAVFGLPKVPDHFTNRDTHELRAPYLARLKNARVVTRQFEVVSPDDRVFDDQFLFERDERNPAQALVLPWLPRLKKQTGRYAVIGTGRAGNYYHWLNDCLPRLRWLESPEAGAFKLLVPDRLLPFHTQTLDALGFTADRRLPFGQEHWQVEELLVPSLPGAPSQSSPPACRWLRERLLAGLPQVDQPLPRRIYVSRALATKRRLLNEGEIIDCLARRGIVSVQTETLSMAEQARLFENADLVFAPHGAGLTNILFMRPGALVLELVPILKPKTCYLSLASAMGVQYACVTDAPDADAPEPCGRQPDRDFSVPTKRIEQALEQLTTLTSLPERSRP